jgi:hypothetical protein
MQIIQRVPLECKCHSGHRLPPPAPPDRPVSPAASDSQTILRDLRAHKAARQTADDLSAHTLRDLRTRKSAARRRIRVLVATARGWECRYLHVEEVGCRDQIHLSQEKEH